LPDQQAITHAVVLQALPQSEEFSGASFLEPSLPTCSGRSLFSSSASSIACPDILKTSLSKLPILTLASSKTGLFPSEGFDLLRIGQDHLELSFQNVNLNTGFQYDPVLSMTTSVQVFSFSRARRD